MTKRTITKLFAVVALAASAPATASPDRPTATTKPRTLPNGQPACGNMNSKSPRPCVAVVPVVREDPKLALERGQIAVAKVLALFRLTDRTKQTPAAEPRRLRNGAPANGNVARRTSGYRPVEPPTTSNDPSSN